MNSPPRNRTIHNCDVMEGMARIPDDCMDCIVTSPPYWNMRTYSVSGEWGTEPTIDGYLDRLMGLMGECRRVLKKTGTIWINIGDSYNSGTTFSNGVGSNVISVGKVTKKLHDEKFRKKPSARIPTRSLLGMPARFQLRCIDAGFINRQSVIWAKPNGLPSPFKNRFTNTYEPVLMFAISPKYHLNLDPIREKCVTDTKPFNIRVREAKAGRAQSRLGSYFSRPISESELSSTDSSGAKIIPASKYDADPASNASRLHRDREGNPHRSKHEATLGPDGKSKPTLVNLNENWKKSRKRTDQPALAAGSGNVNMHTGESMNNPRGKNPGDVWRISVAAQPSLCADCTASRSTSSQGRMTTER